MSTTTLKKELHKTIEGINDNSVLSAIYTLLNNSIEISSEFTIMQHKELEKRLKDHKAGKLKYFTLKEVKAAVFRSLKK